MSHGSLLIRSPKGANAATNIDLVFVGVEYVAAPRYLRNLEIAEPTQDELRSVEEILDKRLLASAVHILIASGKRYPIVAAGFKVDENVNDIFDSPFDH